MSKQKELKDRTIQDDLNDFVAMYQITGDDWSETPENIRLYIKRLETELIDNQDVMDKTIKLYHTDSKEVKQIRAAAFNLTAFMSFTILFVTSYNVGLGVLYTIIALLTLIVMYRNRNHDN